MKKLLGIMVLGLLWCNVGFAEPIKPFDLWCESYKKEIARDDVNTTESYNERYHLYITDEQAFVIGLERMYDNMMRKSSEDTTYYFSSIGFEGKSSIDETGRMRPFNGLSINRTNGEATLTKYLMGVENIVMKCSTEKPKLLF